MRTDQETRPAGVPVDVAADEVRLKRRSLCELQWLGAVVLTALVAGISWAFLAPTRLMQVVDGAGMAIALPGESRHLFEGGALFALVSGVAAVGLTVGLWRFLPWRRGPGAALVLPVLLVAASYLAALVGQTVAGWLHPIPAPVVGAVVEAPARVGSVWFVLAMPLVASFVYWAAALVTVDEDFG